MRKWNGEVESGKLRVENSEWNSIIFSPEPVEGSKNCIKVPEKVLI
jgi:hypothetical protein